MRLERDFWFHAGLAWIFAGSAADLALTLWGLRLGVIEEANPLLAPLLTHRPALGAGLKLGVTLAAVAILRRAYPLRQRLVAAGVGLVGASLLGVLLMHAWWIISFM